jgi:hypothetical protein
MHPVASAVALLSLLVMGAPPKKPVVPKKPAVVIPAPRVNAAAKSVEIDAVVAKREHDDVLKGAIEFLLVQKGGKAYESVFQTDVPAAALHRALNQIGLKSGAPPSAPDALPTGAPVKIVAAFRGADGKQVTLGVEEFILDVQDGKPPTEVRWVYTGSKMTEDPNTNQMVLMASQTKNLVSTHREDPTVLLMNPLPGASGKRYQRNEKKLPKPGTPVKLTFSGAP